MEQGRRVAEESLCEIPHIRHVGDATDDEGGAGIAASPEVDGAEQHGNPALPPHGQDHPLVSVGPGMAIQRRRAALDGGRALGPQVLEGPLQLDVVEEQAAEVVVDRRADHAEAEPFRLREHVHQEQSVREIRELRQAGIIPERNLGSASQQAAPVSPHPLKVGGQPRR